MAKFRRKFYLLTIAALLTASIVLGVMFISRSLTQQQTTGFSLQAVAKDYGTISLDCTYSETSHMLAVKQTTTYINHSDQELSEIKFHLYANAYQKDAEYPVVAKNEIDRAYPNGFSEGYVKVLTPRVIIEGADNTVVTVPLTQKLAPNKSVKVDLQYNIKLANIKHRLGYTDATVNLGNFYAIPAVYDFGWQTYAYSYNGDPFYNEPYNFEVTLHAPDSYIVAASGEQVAPNQYRGYLLRDFALVLSRDFQVISQDVGNTTVNYYYLNDEIPEISLYTAGNALAYFSNQFFNYPYSTLAVVQTDFLHGGMEYGALVYISLDVTDQLQYQTVIVHEIAHQWWYGIVGNNQTRNAWIDEGLAEYCTAVFFETHPQYGKTLKATATENQATIKMFEDIMSQYDVGYTRLLTCDLHHYHTSSEYTINNYARSMILFYNLTEMVGYQNLNDALSQYAHQYCFAFDDEYSLMSHLDAYLGRDVGKYINNYLAGKQQTMLS